MVPPVLTMVDDDSSEIKAKGCELLGILLKNTTPALLARTGLGQVLTDAVMPCLLYLPTLTPEPESIRLLGAAYPALISLARARFEPTTRQTALVKVDRITDKGTHERIKYFDQIIRKGILGGYRHAGEHVKIAELLVTQIAIVIDQLGVHAVKYLKVCLLSHSPASSLAHYSLGSYSSIIGYPDGSVWYGIPSATFGSYSLPANVPFKPLAENETLQSRCVRGSGNLLV